MIIKNCKRCESARWGSEACSLGCEDFETLEVVGDDLLELPALIKGYSIAERCGDYHFRVEIRVSEEGFSLYTEWLGIPAVTQPTPDFDKIRKTMQECILRGFLRKRWFGVKTESNELSPYVKVLKS